jgi:hypothetical protein
MAAYRRSVQANDGARRRRDRIPRPAIPGARLEPTSIAAIAGPSGFAETRSVNARGMSGVLLDPFGVVAMAVRSGDARAGSAARFRRSPSQASIHDAGRRCPSPFQLPAPPLSLHCKDNGKYVGGDRQAKVLRRTITGSAGARNPRDCLRISAHPDSRTRNIETSPLTAAAEHTGLAQKKAG